MQCCGLLGARCPKKRTLTFQFASLVPSKLSFYVTLFPGISIKWLPQCAQVQIYINFKSIPRYLLTTGSNVWISNVTGYLFKIGLCHYPCNSQVVHQSGGQVALPKKNVLFYLFLFFCFVLSLQYFSYQLLSTI